MALVQLLESLSLDDARAETEDEFFLIDKLEALGIDKGEIKKAKDAGYHTVPSLLMSTTKTLGEIKGLSGNNGLQMAILARKLCSTSGYFMTAKEFDEQRDREIVHVSTGSDAVDAVLGGGVETQNITEIYGEFRCGKTQMCLTMALTAQINPRNPGKVAYIDTEGAFRPDRIKAIAERYGVDYDSVLNNIVYVRVHTWEHQVAMLEPLAAMISAEPFKLIIMDSVLSLLSENLFGQGVADRQQELHQMLSKLKELALKYNVAVCLTNQVMSDPSGGAMMVSDPKKAVVRHVMAHMADVRLSVHTAKGEQRVLKVVQSPNMPEAEASFSIANEGVVDYKD